MTSKIGVRLRWNGALSQNIDEYLIFIIAPISPVKKYIRKSIVKNNQYINNRRYEKYCFSNFRSFYVREI